MATRAGNVFLEWKHLPRAPGGGAAGAHLDVPTNQKCEGQKVPKAHRSLLPPVEWLFVQALLSPHGQLG